MLTIQQGEFQETKWIYQVKISEVNIYYIIFVCEQKLTTEILGQRMFEMCTGEHRYPKQVKFQVNLSYHMFSEDLCYPQQISKLQEAESCSKPKWKQNCKKHCPVTVPSECFKWMFTRVCFNSMTLWPLVSKKGSQWVCWNIFSLHDSSFKWRYQVNV